MNATLKSEKHLQELCHQLINYTENLKTPSQGHIDVLASIFDQINDLIKTTTVEDAPKILTSTLIMPLISPLRKIRAAYEFEIEKASAVAFLNNGIIGAELEENITNPYSNSAILNDIFTTRISQYCKSCLIVGSGPLPVTALLFLSHNQLDITCLDISYESNVISKQIFDAIKLYSSIKHITVDIKDFKDFSSYDLIFINGLVGNENGSSMKNNKSDIINHIITNKGQNSLMMLRSGYGLNQLFYPKIILPVEINEHVTTIHPSSLERSSIVYFNANLYQANSNSHLVGHNKNY